MLSEDFYQSFKTKYILICQPDAFCLKMIWKAGYWRTMIMLELHG